MNFAELPDESEIRSFLDGLRGYLDAEGYVATLRHLTADNRVAISLDVPVEHSATQLLLLEMALRARLFEEFPALEGVEFLRTDCELPEGAGDPAGQATPLPRDSDEDNPRGT